MKNVLKNIYFGKNDGKEEATYNRNFEHYFYNYNNYYDKILNPDKFLLLGRKGSGKSILAEYIAKKSTLKSTSWFCEVISYKEFNLNELKYLRTENISPNEYTEIWHWITLTAIAKKILKDESLSLDDNIGKLREFFEINYGSTQIDNNKLVQITKNNQIQGGILKGLITLGGSHGVSQSYNTGSYLDFIEDLENNVIEVLGNSTNKFTIIFDELDDKFKNESMYKAIIISLIKNTARFNRKLFSQGIDCKIIVLIRTDIFNILNDPDLNKIQVDNSVEIDWGNSVDKYSPLLLMIYNKIRKSLPNMKDKSDTDIYYLMFPSNINGRTMEESLLGRTFFRPRDITTYFNLIAEEYGNFEKFEWYHFTKKEENYSAYFLREIRNELCGHYDEEIIEQALRLLRQFKKVEFEYAEIDVFYQLNKERLFKTINLDEALAMLFEFGAIGNKWFNEQKARYYYSWNYRKEADIDYDKTFVVHLGLRKTMGMS